MEVFVSFIKDHHFHFDQTTVVCEVLKEKLSEVENIPSNHFILESNGRAVGDDEIITHSISVLRATLCHGLKGGKGGFGAMLRKKAKEKGPKKTVDFGSCRDLSGRRIRHVNDEIILKKWQEAKDRGEAFNVDQETPSGINLWFLPTPTWTEGFGKKSKNKLRQSKRKTSLCSDWLESHGPNRRVPKNAPAWWGCPRGNRCDYAHGEDELEATTRQALQMSKKREILDAESEKLNLYLNPLSQGNSESNNDDITDLVMLGLSKTFKRPRHNNHHSDSETTTVTITGVTSDAAVTQHNHLKQPDIVTSKKSSDSDVTELLQPVHSQLQAVEEINDKEEGEGDIVQGIAMIESDDSEDEEEEQQRMKLSSESHCDWLQIVAGDAVIMEDGAVLGQNEFSTVLVRDCQLVEDSWYYEVELLTDGLMQIGWACVGFQLKEEGDGVGDDEFSWSYDGYRCKKWHVQNTDYGGEMDHHTNDSNFATNINRNSATSSRSSSSRSSSSGSSSSAAASSSSSKDIINSKGNNNTNKSMNKWKSGDIIGCYLELIPSPSSVTTTTTATTTTTGADVANTVIDVVKKNGSNVRMVFYKNGVSLGDAFSFPYSPSNTSASRSNSSSSSSSSNSNDSNNNTNDNNSSNNNNLQIGFFPALSVDSFQQVVVNIGQTPYKYHHHHHHHEKEKGIEKSSNTILKTVFKNQKDGNHFKTVHTTTNTNNTSTTAITLATASVKDSNGNFLPLDLESNQYNNSKVLEQFGSDYLKFELIRRGLKYGGTIEEKAKRLFSVRGVPDTDIPVKLKAISVIGIGST